MTGGDVATHSKNDEPCPESTIRKVVLKRRGVFATFLQPNALGTRRRTRFGAVNSLLVTVLLLRMNRLLIICAVPGHGGRVDCGVSHGARWDGVPFVTTETGGIAKGGRRGRE